MLCPETHYFSCIITHSRIITMLHHLSLPSRRTPHPPGSIFSGSQSLAYKQLGPFGLSPSKILSQPRSCSGDGAQPAETGPDLDEDDIKFRKGAKLTPICSEEEENFGFDPADSSTWGVRSLPYWHQAVMLPGSRKGGGLHNR
ncbi:hypothetical protein V8C37DRAFT_324507 [Trichoderma ceciliae]